MELELPFTWRHNLHERPRRRGRRARRRRARRRAARRARSRSLRGERVALAAAARSINDCYNASPLSMRAALDDLAAEPPGGASPCWATCSSSAPPRTSATARSAPTPPRRASTCSSPSARARPRCSSAFDGEAHAVADAAEAAALAARPVEPGDVLLVKGSRGVGLEVVAEALRGGAGLMGEVLIAGTASLLICIFLSPKFISFLRRASSASRSARRARRSTTPRRARRRWAGSSSSPRSRCRSCC